MVVDDEARIRKGIARLVESCGEGWEVVAMAQDGIEALDCLAQLDGDIDLLISDVRMPEMDGLTLIHEAKKRYSSLYPLLISGYDEFSYVQSAIREGALDYLLKPVDREQFRLRMIDIRSIILGGRLQHQKRGELEKQAEKFKHSKQTQTLSDITSAGIDATRLGYWVDEFPKGKYVLLCIRMDTLPVKTRTYTSKDWKAYYYAIENIIGEVVGSQGGEVDQLGWSWRGSDSDFWVLISSPYQEVDLEGAAEELSMQIRSCIQTYTPFSVSIAYSSTIEDLYLLPDARRQCQSNINYRLLYGGNKVFGPAVLETMSDRSEVKLERDLLPILQKLKRSIEQGNSSDAAELCNQYTLLLEKLESPESLQTAVQNAVILIQSVRLENQRGLAAVAAIEEQFQHARKAASVYELKQFIKELAAQGVEEIRQAREQGSMKPIEQAKSWIREHLGQEMTIKKIADHVHMNPTYFSEYFKLQTGETILDYLTRQRMEKAKELLNDPVLKIQDICGMIGYQDVKYFSGLFKQWSGQTPSKYRANMQS